MTFCKVQSLTWNETAVASTFSVKSHRQKPPPLLYPPKTLAVKEPQTINNVVYVQPRTPKDTMALPWSYRFNSEVITTSDLPAPLLAGINHEERSNGIYDSLRPQLRHQMQTFGTGARVT